MSKENKATLEMLLCAALWSIAGILFKLIPWNGFAVAGMRSLVAGITIYVSMRLMGFRYVLNRRTLPRKLPCRVIRLHFRKRRLDPQFLVFNYIDCGKIDAVPLRTHLFAP